MDSRPIKTRYDTINSRIKSSKINLKSKSNQKVPLTIDGFNPYLVKKESQKIGATTQNKTKISHASGPIPNNSRTLKQSFLNPNAQYDEDIVSNWIPHMGISVVDEGTGQPLSAAEANSRRTEQ